MSVLAQEPPPPSHSLRGDGAADADASLGRAPTPSMLLDRIPVPYSLLITEGFVLKRRPPFQAVSVRVLGRLWQRQNRVFSRLQAALRSVMSGAAGDPSASNYSSERVALDVKLSVAAVILDVCTANSQQGAALVSLLLQLLKDSHASVLCLALQSFSALVQWRAVAFHQARVSPLHQIPVL